MFISNISTSHGTHTTAEIGPTTSMGTFVVYVGFQPKDLCVISRQTPRNRMCCFIDVKGIDTGQTKNKLERTFLVIKSDINVNWHHPGTNGKDALTKSNGISLKDYFEHILISFSTGEMSVNVILSILDNLQIATISINIIHSLKVL